MKDVSMAVSNPSQQQLNLIQRLALAFVAFGLLILFLAWSGKDLLSSLESFMISSISISTGAVLYAFAEYFGKSAGIKNNGVFFKSISSR